MVRRIFLILILLAFTGTLQAQQVNTAPDCSGKFNFTAIGTSLIIPNGSGCTLWFVTYKTSGFTSVTLEFDYAADKNSTPGALALWPGTVPMTTVGQGMLTAFGYAPWAAVRLTEVIGSGIVSGVFVGWRQPLVAPAAALPVPSLGLPLPVCNALRQTNCRRS